MKWIFKDSSNYKQMVWKSGKGRSIQIHIEPEHLTVQDPFLWRISSATVSSVGPFSAFDSYTRTLILLKGNKLQLFHRQKPLQPVQLEHFEPYTFNGGWETDCIFIPLESDCLRRSGSAISSRMLQLSVESTGNISNNSSSDSIGSNNSPISSPHNSGCLYLPNDESTDFNIITRDGLVSQNCIVHHFKEEGEKFNLKLAPPPPTHFSSEEQFENKTLKTRYVLVYSFNADLTIRQTREEDCYQEARIKSGHSLILQDISDSELYQSIQLVNHSTHQQPTNSTIIIVYINEFNQ